MKDLVAGASTSQNASADDATVDRGPSTLTLLREPGSAGVAPKIMAQSATDDDRLMASASRSESRAALASCDAGAIAQGGNGKLDRTVLCTLPQGGGYQLQPAAAVAFKEMSDAYEAHFGYPMTVASAYRSYSEQSRLKGIKGWMAAAPGTSNHGWGYAVDFTSKTYRGTAQHAWIAEHAKSYGWVNPDWAKGAKYEPWHFEYVPGVERVGGVL